VSRSPFGPIVEPPFDPDEDNRRVLAVAALVARAGGKAFEVGYLHEDAPTVEEAGWWVVAEWRGGLDVRAAEGSRGVCVAPRGRPVEVRLRRPAAPADPDEVKRLRG
jgi:hypothetical protein